MAEVATLRGLLGETAGLLDGLGPRIDASRGPMREDVLDVVLALRAHHLALAAIMLRLGLGDLNIEPLLTAMKAARNGTGP